VIRLRNALFVRERALADEQAEAEKRGNEPVYYLQVLLSEPIQPPRHSASSFLGAVGDEQAATTNVMIVRTARVSVRRDMVGSPGGCDNQGSQLCPKVGSRSDA
jgi:hypothetical protein